MSHRVPFLLRSGARANRRSPAPPFPIGQGAQSLLRWRRPSWVWSGRTPMALWQGAVTPTTRTCASGRQGLGRKRARGTLGARRRSKAPRPRLVVARGVEACAESPLAPAATGCWDRHVWLRARGAGDSAATWRPKTRSWRCRLRDRQRTISVRAEPPRGMRRKGTLHKRHKWTSALLREMTWQMAVRTHLHFDRRVADREELRR